MKKFDKSIKGFSGYYRFLSNFYPCEFEIDGIIYPSSEHYYMCQKTTDMAKRQEILDSENPGRAKRLGRALKLRPDWDEKYKNKAMMTALVAKFSIPDLKERLLATRGFYLEETNHWNDTYWGVCNGVGQNMLGRMLMFIRDNLLEE